MEMRVAISPMFLLLELAALDGDGAMVENEWAKPNAQDTYQYSVCVCLLICLLFFPVCLLLHNIWIVSF